MSKQDGEDEIPQDGDTQQAEAETSDDLNAESTSDEVGSIRDETITELKDELGRARARYQDYRRRVERDASRQRKLVAKELWGQILPIMDNFGAALDALDKGQDAEQVMIGVKMIHQMMERLLEDNGVQIIPSIGETFDPHLHEAIARAPSEDMAPNTVMTEVQRGYRMDELVVRPAKVTVVQSEEDAAAVEDDAPTQD